jgi:nucleoid DNA-binding protein
MNRNELIDQIAAGTQRSRKEAEDALNAMIAAIGGALTRGEKIDLRGFGSFQVSGKKERQGRNPRTGETITIFAKKVLVFKAGKELADRVNAIEGRTGEAGQLPAGNTVPLAEPSPGPAKLHGDKIDV